MSSEFVGKRVTLKDVAKRAGVSVGMASRVLGSYGSYSEKTKRLVMKAAQDLKYRPNALARSLRVGRTNAIGLVVSNVLSHHWTTFIRAVEKAAAERDYQVLLGATSDDPSTERAYLHALHDRFVDGVIVTPSEENEPLIAELLTSGLPMVLVESPNGDLAAPRVNLDNRAGARAAVDHLLQLGHRRIGIVTGNLSVSPARERADGYRDALQAAGLDLAPALMVTGDFDFETAYAATAKLMSLPGRPTALFVCNEVMAGAALQYLKDEDVALPDELSLVAFDDPAWMSFYRPAITTVRTPRAEMARLALDTLLAKINGPQGRGEVVEQRVLPLELVVRESAVEMRGPK